MSIFDWSFDISDEAALSGVVNWDILLKRFPILERLKGVDQNPVYHGEGNVFNHTKMVVEALVKNPQWRLMFRYDQSKLFLSALFHDIGKVSTTVMENGVLTSKGHSGDGAVLVRGILWDYDNGYKVPFDIRESVSSMILLHMLPVYLLEKIDPLYSICAASTVINNSELALLSDVDNEGRVCDKKYDATSAIQLFSEFCIENHCYINRKEFKSDHSRFLYFFDRVGHPNLERYHDCKGTAHMMSGLPGSGKDTYIRNNLSAYPVVSLDDLREEMDVKVMESEGQVSQLAKERCKEYMRIGNDFVFNATNLIKHTRSKWIRLFHQYGYRVEIHYIEPSFTTIIKQNANRDKKVPEGVIRRMFERLEPPTRLECYDLHFRV